MGYATLGMLAACCVATALSTPAISANASQPLTNEGLRIEALRAIFAGEEISVEPSRKIKDSEPDSPGGALADEPVYLVKGKATNEAERSASADIITGQFSYTRQVRFKVFRWPSEGDSGLLAALQYDFADANPASFCPSLGLLVHLVSDAGKWKNQNEYLLETMHHSSLPGIRMLDLTGKGADSLVIESDHGGAGVAVTSLHIFNLGKGRFDERLDIDSRVDDSDQEGYTQTLDIKRTVQSQGRIYCFSKTTLYEKGKWFKAARITHPCYASSYGVDPSEVREKNALLAPIR